MRGAKIDRAITKLLKDNFIFQDDRSFVSLGAEPHLYLRGYDVVKQRERLWQFAKYDQVQGRNCALCGGPIINPEWEMDHKQGGTVGRHDDLSNLQIVHSECHRKKHVQVRWSSRAEKA